MNQNDKVKIADIMERNGVVVGYLFGSAKQGTMGPHSDIDVGVVFAVDVLETDDLKRRMSLSSEISRALKVPDADVINLKTVSGPLIKYNAVFDGELILEKDSELRFAIECSIVREYEDTRSLRSIASLVFREYINA